MMVDAISIGLKALMYLTLLQAAGCVFYLAIFAARLPRSAGIVWVVSKVSAVACVVLTLLHTGFQAARMSGELSGIWDGHLEGLAWRSTLGTSAAVRIIALALIPRRGSRASGSIGFVQQAGAVAALLSLLLAGHTSVHAERWLLAPLLAVHLIVLAWWFGSLVPLALAASREQAATSEAVVSRFSAIAGWLVPGLALAGLGIALILTEGRYSIHDPYDLALTGKALGFSLLMGLAAINRWLLGPRLATGLPRAVRAFEVSLAVEWLLVAGIVTVTATMTSLYSPELM